jgi:hydrogenase expression/formation protein HypC
MCLGIPGQIVAISNVARRLATVEVGGIRREVNVGYVVDEAHPVEQCVGDWVLIHIGFAVSRIDAAEAAKTLEILMELDNAQTQLNASASGP